MFQKGHKKVGGRKPGEPNHVTTGARKRALALWDAIGPDLEEWIRRCAEGEPVPMVKKDPATGAWTPVLDQAGNPVLVRDSADPGQAFGRAMTLLEYILPKLGRTEVTGEGGDPIQIVVKTYKGDE